MAEIARNTSFEESTDPFLFALLSRALAAVEEARGEAHLDLALAAYAFKVCAHQGWRPVTDSCVMCGEPHPTRFSCAAGGALCASCAKDVAGAEQVAEAALLWVATLVGSTFDALMAQAEQAALFDLLADLAVRWARTHLECRLKASEFYLGL